MATSSAISNGPSPGQCALLSFFGKPIPATKSAASIVLGEVLKDPSNARRWVIERARRCVAVMEPTRRAPDDPQDSHTVFFNAVRVLIHGFGLSQDEARPLIDQYLTRSDLPWQDHEIRHKLLSVDAQPSQHPRGYMVGDDVPRYPNAETKKEKGIVPEREVRKKVEFDAAELKAIAAPWRGVADLVWLANRSAVDPATVSHTDFLSLLYQKGERVLVFTDYFSQGQALWPDDAVANTGREGVWFLPAPVDGEYHPNPRSLDKDTGKARMSRRSEESVRSYRYLLLESDKADMRDWLGFIVQAPLRIEAIYTSGGRSIHVLVRVDCSTKGQWDEAKRELMPFLMGTVMLGGDRGVLSGVRLSRLPGCYREGKYDDQDRYTRFPRPKLQKLLYVRPAADGRPICEMPARRDVEALWCAKALLGVDGHLEAAALAEARAGLAYYANVSASCATALRDLEGIS